MSRLISIDRVPSASALGTFVKTVQGRHIIFVELEIVDLRIRLDPTGSDRFGQGNVADHISPVPLSISIFREVTARTTARMKAGMKASMRFCESIVETRRRPSISNYGC